MIKTHKSLSLFFSNTNFLGSYDKLIEIPNQNKTECCFIGRSNVGKSSIINAITRSNKLAKISKKPGKTKMINIYEINNKLNLVDLPGYGYAKISKSLRDNISNLLNNYLTERNNLKKIYMLIDCQIGIKNVDMDAFEIVSDTNKSLSIILTKIDKCSENFISNQKKSILSFFDTYPKSLTSFFVSSCKNFKGIIDIQKDIFTLSNSK